jgi:N-acetylglucosaminyldiphosphoundecaprenol N-acetyl-beta-D-mannosaminyltransferase
MVRKKAAARRGARGLQVNDVVPARVRLFGVDIDVVRRDDAVREVLEMSKTPGTCRFVVTPNADHILLLQHNDELKRAYADAALVIADGWPVVFASHLLARPLPERVTGSDLVPSVFLAADRSDPIRVYLFGAAPGVAERAAVSIEARYPAVRVVGAHGPPLGFERDSDETRRSLARIRDAAPELLLVGLGAPKQELWVHAHRAEVHARVALCIGATIDFLAGERLRAPPWMQRAGLEWLYRMMQEPTRLGPRYGKNAVDFPRLVLREWRNGRRPR